MTVERRDPFGSYFSFRWLLWMTLGLGPYDSGDADPLMRVWDSTWGALMASPYAHTIFHGLERALPKSQVVLASKPGGSRPARLRRGLLNPAVWKRRLRTGSVRLGGVELTWNIHTARRSP